MNSDAPKKLLRQISQLQSRLLEAEDTLDAIRSGSIDALVVRTPRGEQLFTLRGADETYRALVEAMNEGAVTLNRDTISYCNHHFAQMARAPLEKVISKSIFELVRSPEFRQLIQQLQKGTRQRGAVEAVLHAADGTAVPVVLSGYRFASDGKRAIGLVVNDITQRKEVEQARLELSRRILNAQELERQRVARDLHDGVNQLLSSAKYRLSSSCQNLEPESRENVRLALNLVEKAISEVKLISRNLRPSELDDLGLAPALRSLSQEFEKQTEINTRLFARSNGRMPAEVEMALYRIAQEALNNAANHSRATQVQMDLRYSDSCVELSIQDNGKGIPARLSSNHNGGWGLKNMKERASLLGGRLLVESADGKGTRISVSIPLPKATRKHAG